MPAGRLDLRVERRTPYIPGTIDFVGMDFAGAAFKLEVRTEKDTEGTALISIAGASAGSEGISVTTTEDDGITTSHVQIQINEATIEALPFAGERGDDLELWWDFHITPSGGTKRNWLGGKFIVRAGVTI